MSAAIRDLVLVSGRVSEEMLALCLQADKIDTALAEYFGNARPYDNNGKLA